MVVYFSKSCFLVLQKLVLVPKCVDEAGRRMEGMQVTEATTIDMQKQVVAHAVDVTPVTADTVVDDSNVFL